MPPRKRAAEDDGSAARSTKTPKTEPSPAKPRGRPKRGPKTNMAAATFKSRALPLHINITHTPPALADDGATVSAASADPGFVGSTTLLPGTFATGSYGWKGARRLTIEVENPDGGEKEKVHVMLNINATVMGSKGAKDGDDGEAGEGEGEDADAEKAVEDAVAEDVVVEDAGEETKEGAETKPTDGQSGAKAEEYDRGDLGGGGAERLDE
ncbi:hypothetical protein C8Q78DRAFT_993449 [Trametes maxima]|nr:hypothetical protein C8Q78DRAFT_993449 [Trametes maxima]